MFLSNYNETIEYLYSNLPMFQRVGAVAYKKDLTNTLALCKVLGNPHHTFKSIHVAGTNGKGSTSHMLASVLQEAGYQTGLYTSPHLKNFTERIRINGEEVSRDFVVDFVNRVKPVIEKINPSFFEITVAMAFDYFAKQKIDIAVVETGLGGRLDSTNVITPVLSVITNIGWDHMDLLGDTLEKIAVEKAGIIKSKIPVLISQLQTEVKSIFNEKSRALNAPLFFADRTYYVTQYENGNYKVLKNGKVFIDSIDIPLKGSYQTKNLPGVLQSVDVLNEIGFNISTAQCIKGLERVVDNTRLKGRWQKLQDKPLIICDTGHNLDGIREVVAQIHKQRFARLHIVWGMVKDKDITPVLSILPKNASYFFCQADIPRALDADQLFEKAKQAGLPGRVVRNVNAAIDEAKKNAQADDFIFIGGSTFVVAEINQL